MTIGERRESMPADDQVLLAEVAALGEFFRVDPARAAHPQGTDRLADLYAGDPALLDHIRVATDRLGSSELRVGGSILFQGLAARLWSPVVATALAYDRVLTLPPTTTCWHPTQNGGRLQATDPHLDPAGADPATRPAAVVRAVVDLHLVPLVAAVSGWVRLPAALLWGNAASALVGSLGVLVRARPSHREAATRLLRALLVDPSRDPHDGDPLGGDSAAEYPLAEGGALTEPSSADAPSADRTGLPGFVRSSCCLYYRIPGGGLCGDCPLSSTPTLR